MLGVGVLKIDHYNDICTQRLQDFGSDQQCKNVWKCEYSQSQSMLMKRYIGSVTQSSNETPPTKTIQTSEDMYDLSLSLLPQQLHRLIAVVADGNIKTSLATSSNPDLDASWRQRQLGVHNAHQKGFSEWGPQNDYLRMILQAIIS
ncbi:hypothetical protein JHK84_031336 [Glycine max]|nr:hypothetical protein JHK84_031336 [Glycine max]